MPFFSLTHEITYITGYLLTRENEYSVHHDHIWAVYNMLNNKARYFAIYLISCVGEKNVKNTVHFQHFCNKTVLNAINMMLNLAEHRLILANSVSAHGLVGLVSDDISRDFAG